MGVDLSGSQAVMSATVQSNFVVKSVFGLFTASLSDRIGRRPAMVSCLCLLTATTLCRGCAAFPLASSGSLLGVFCRALGNL